MSLMMLIMVLVMILILTRLIHIDDDVNTDDDNTDKDDAYCLFRFRDCTNVLRAGSCHQGCDDRRSRFFDDQDFL